MKGVVASFLYLLFLSNAKSGLDSTTFDTTGNQRVARLVQTIEALRAKDYQQPVWRVDTAATSPAVGCLRTVFPVLMER